jgi:amino acid transporter
LAEPDAEEEEKEQKPAIMEKEMNPKTASLGSDSVGAPAPPLYGESEATRGTLTQRMVDSFRRDPNAHVTKRGQVGADGNVFDTEAAAQATAQSPLHRRLKSRHLQMIAIGGSIGEFNRVRCGRHRIMADDA